MSKSIQRGQRETSLPSLFDYTLKFLNDDMAIPKVEKEPLIEKIIEDDYLENQSQLNQYNDAKSSYFSNELQEIDLKKMNNIYTSHCFLMKNCSESVH